MTLSRLIRFFIAALLSTVAAAQAATVGDVSHIKGQEGDTLTGFGLVVGLSGTGDGSTPTLRAYAKFLEQLGTPLTRGDRSASRHAPDGHATWFSGHAPSSSACTRFPKTLSQSRIEDVSTESPIVISMSEL